MTVKKKQIFGRILQHRLESAKLFPNLGETGKAFTEYVQGNPISKPAIEKHAEKVRLSLISGDFLSNLTFLDERSFM